MRSKRDPLVQRRMTYVRLHLDILFGRGSRAGEPILKSLNVPIQIISIAGNCLLGSVRAQLATRETSSSQDATKLILHKRQSQSQGVVDAEPTDSVSSDAENDTVRNTENVEVEPAPEELEQLPRTYVAVLGGPCASNHEHKLFRVKRMQLVGVLILDILVTSLLLYRYKVLLDEDRFIVALRMTEASAQAALSLAICVWGLAAVALNRAFPLVLFRVFANIHFFLFFFRVPYLLYAVRYVLDIIAIALATTLATRMSPSYFITSGASDPVLNADTSLQTAGNDRDGNDDENDDDNQSQDVATITDIETVEARVSDIPTRFSGVGNGYIDSSNNTLPTSGSRDAVGNGSISHSRSGGVCTNDDNEAVTVLPETLAAETVAASTVEVEPSATVSVGTPPLPGMTHV